MISIFGCPYLANALYSFCTRWRGEVVASSICAIHFIERGHKRAIIIHTMPLSEELRILSRATQGHWQNEKASTNPITNILPNCLNKQILARQWHLPKAIRHAKLQANRTVNRFIYPSSIQGYIYFQGAYNFSAI